MSRRGVTLVEILVVVGLIAVLAGILLPSLQAARESVRRTSCSNNLRQLGLALAAYESATGRYPAGAESREWSGNRRFPHQFFRWSALAHLAPYFEEETLFAELDLKVPLFTGFGSNAISNQNRAAVARSVPLFLCPSDRGRPVSPVFGPTNYAVCTGSGGEGGTPFETDGLFFINSETRARTVSDGLSKTVAFSESTLGEGPTASADPAAANPATAYAFIFFTPLTDERCGNARNWNFTDLRGFSWANGEYRTTLYNHQRSPNDAAIDCIAALMTTPDLAKLYAGYGWRAARSRHPGGVNLTFADAAVRFIDDAVDPAVWKAAATRAGGEAMPRLGGQ
jgi:prepilin-type N-terminal cleavage/methylation domain-containing protein/prepilin-type processing-associated H-X9-DG protein